MARQFTTAASDYIEMPDDSRFNGQLPMTVFGWCVRDTDAGLNRIMTTDGVGKWSLGTIGKRIMFTKLSVVNTQSPLEFSNWSAGEWRFMAASLTTSNVRFVMITQSGQVEAQDAADSSGLVNGGFATAKIGRLSTVEIEPLDGKIATVGKVNSALNDSQLKSIAFASRPEQVGIAFDFFMPIEGWAVEKDYSGWGNNGYVVGAPIRNDPQILIRGPIFRPELSLVETEAPTGRIMSSLANYGGLAGPGGMAGPYGGLAG